MPSLRYVPLAGAALKEFYHQQAENENHHGYVYPSDCHSSYQGANNNSNSTNSESEPFLGCIVSSRNEDTPSSSSNYNYAADCDVRKKEDICTYTDRSNYVYNSTTKREMDGYLSDTILDKVLNCDYSCTSETCEPLKERSTFEKRFEELKAYQAKHGNCHVSTERAGGDRSLGRWCSRVRQSMNEVRNNRAPIVGGFSEHNIKRLRDIGFVL